MSDELGLPEDDEPEVIDAPPFEDNIEMEPAPSAEPEIARVADLLAGALLSGLAQAAEVALARYNKLGRVPEIGEPPA